MLVEDSKYKDFYNRKVSLKSGNFYYFEKFIVGEIKEGVHFNWEIAKDSIDSAYEH